MSVQRIAVFVDVENLTGWIKANGLQMFLEELRGRGDIIGRAYADWGHAALSAHQLPLVQMGFELIHTWHPVSKKNSADIRMSLDILETALTDTEISTYVLITGDSDFTHVFRRLYQLKKDVWGVGPKSVLSTIVPVFCRRYITISDSESAPAPVHLVETAVSEPVPSKPAVSATEKPVSPPVAGNNETKAMKKAILAAQEVLSQASALPIHSSQVKGAMQQRLGGFDQKKLGISSFNDFLRRVPGVVLKQSGQTWCVDFKQPSPNKLNMRRVYEAALKKTNWPVRLPESTVNFCHLLVSRMPPMPKSDMPAYIANRSGVDEAEAKKVVTLFFKSQMFDRFESADGDVLFKMRDTGGGYMREIDCAMYGRIIRFCKDTHQAPDLDTLRAMSYCRYARSAFEQIYRKAEHEQLKISAEAATSAA